MKIRTTKTIISLLAAGALALPMVLQAQPTAHYAAGVEGLKAATLPPPGIYLRDYNVAYYADTLNDNLGHGIQTPQTKAFIYANVPRLIWITDLQILGGNIGVDALLPLSYKDLEVKNGSTKLFDHDTFGIGDFFAEVSWSKHTPHWDFSGAYGIWAPTGDSSPAQPTWAGQGFWTHMFTAGATYYFDQDKKWAVSALNRYEINHENEDTDVTPGQAYTLEYGLSYALAPTIDVGAAGYYQQQVTEDRGPGVTPARDRVAGIGPEISVFYPKCALGWSFRYAYEFMSESRLQGHTFSLTITKRF